MNRLSAQPSTVAYLGPEGTFAHAVAQDRFGRRSSLVPCPSIKTVFDHVATQSGSSGIVPLENSSGGWIYDTIELLIKNAPKIQIREELPLDVKLAFVGHKGRPIKAIYSHFAPLKHFAHWLDAHYPSVEQIACASTAHAAQQARGNPRSAALTSRQAAAIYGLDVLKYPIDPNEVNVTSFLQIAYGENQRVAGNKMALVVRLKNESGSLAKFLEPFSRAKINLTRIISRPIHGQPMAYHFLVEVKNSSGLANALDEAESASSSLVSLGDYSVRQSIRA